MANLFFSKNKTIFLFLVTISLASLSSSYIVLPFTEISQDEGTTPNNFEQYFISKHLNNHLLTNMNIGLPVKTVNIEITMNNNLFLLGEGLCLKNQPSPDVYVPKDSSYFLKILRVKSDNPDYESLMYEYDIYSLYNSTNLISNETIIGFHGIYAENYRGGNNGGFCGRLGLSSENYESQNVEKTSFVESLKLKNTIGNLIWTYHYFDREKFFNKVDIYFKTNFDGVFIFGEFPHVYASQQYDRKDYQTVNSIHRKNENDSSWSLGFAKIYFKENGNQIDVNDNFEAELNINLNYIEASGDYYDLIKEKYFNKYLTSDICHLQTVSINDKKYETISCDKEKFTEKDMTQFPSIFFYQYQLDYTFSLSFPELFDEIENRIAFLVVRGEGENTKWKLGKVFMKKYQFVFDYDAKTIGIYLGDKKKFELNRSNLFLSKYKDVKVTDEIKSSNLSINLNKYIWFAILFVIVASNIAVCRFLMSRRRKIKANELEDEFDYVSKEQKYNDKKNQIELSNKINQA